MGENGLRARVRWSSSLYVQNDLSSVTELSC